MRRAILISAAAALCALLAGCANPDSPPRAPVTGAGSPGEPAAPPPRAPISEAPAAAQPTPQQALAYFGSLYVNWDYRDLPARQRRLAAIAVGDAHATERQAAAQSARDTTLTRAHAWNKGVLVSIAADRLSPGVWVVVSREQTGGSGEYEALPAGFHLTLARVARVDGGWAVSSWEPQS
ncbi:MAG: hypothetical protein JWM60_1680 [Solirubrobacterales bacterium]|nr:hypothetical protein [Solirubrobacterales bacterium]